MKPVVHEGRKQIRRNSDNITFDIMVQFVTQLSPVSTQCTVTFSQY